MNDIISESAAEPGKVQPFTTSKTKFAAMSICTLGLYEVFWSYRNWRYVKERDASGIRPVWRAAFYPLWHYSLLSELASAVGSQRLSSAGCLSSIGYFPGTAVVRGDQLWAMRSLWKASTNGSADDP